MQESTLKRFNSIEGAQNYANKFETRWEERLRNRSEQKLIESVVSLLPNEDLSGLVLDMPCGVGRFYSVLHSRAPRVVQADWSQPMLHAARAVSSGSAAGYVRLRATELPFADQQFDLILSVRLCHHLPSFEERHTYIAELLRVSRKWVILSYLDTDSPHNRYRSTTRWMAGKPPKWHMPEEELEAIASEKGYVVVKSTLLSRFFSGQRYAILMQTSASEAACQARESSRHERQKIETGPIASPDAVAPVPVNEAQGLARSTRLLRAAYKWHGVVIACVMLFCLFTGVGEVEWDAVVLPAGLALFLIGFLLRIWSQIHLDNQLRTSAALATTGPYAWVRNPKFLGNLCILTGLAVFAETIYVAPFVVVTAWVMYTLAVRYEEMRLAETRGPAYRDYMSVVPRWLPKGPTIETGADLRPDYGLTLRAEGLTLLYLLPFVLMEMLYS